MPDVIANKLDHLLILTSGTEQYLITCTNKKYKFLLTTTLTISAHDIIKSIIRSLVMSSTVSTNTPANRIRYRITLSENRNATCTQSW